MKSCWLDSHLNPENSEWLVENSKEMNQSVKQIMKLAEDNIEENYQIKSEVIVQVEELRRIYQSLTERYDHLTGELRRSVASDFLSQRPDSGLDQNSPMVTPGTESSSFSSDSDSESFSSSVNIYLSCTMDAGNGVEHHKVNEQGRNLQKKRLPGSVSVLAENMVAQLESLERNMKMRGADLELENRKVVELQKQIVELEAHVSDSNSESLRLMDELAGSKEKFKASEEEIAMLKHEAQEEIATLSENPTGRRSRF
ncbi:hypothetical protein V6N12_068570 [Hibiscus sabdariffa]|uniref:NAB domain-containing protein n=1 Tax=Hibiscus sabdariffa TaxID=183260 RepID=A0ABR2FQE6_9ROSI